MAREFPLWVIVGLPWIAALFTVVGARPLAGLLGSRRAGLFAHYLGLGATILAVLFSVQAIDHLLAPDDPRGLAHTPWPELIPPVVIGELRIELTLVADRLSSCAALLITVAVGLARLFAGGPAGARDLGLGPNAGLIATPDEDEDEPEAAVMIQALRRLGSIGLLEGAALLVVLAGNLGVAAIGWAVLGFGAAAAVARQLGDERRASAATRVLGLGIAGDLCLGAAAVVLVIAGIGLDHNQLWAPQTGDQLYAIGLLGVPAADLLATLLLGAAYLRLASLIRAGNSLAEALLDAALIPGPAIYLLLRYNRVLGYAPTLLAISLVLGIVVALTASAVALLRPAAGEARRSPRPGVEQGLAGTGMAWTGLVAMAIGVGAWRTVALLLLARVLGRLGLRLALLVAHGGRLPTWSARVARLLTWAAAGIAPGLGFVAISWTLVAVLARASLLGAWVNWIAALAVLAVAFAHTAAVARIWYEALGPEPGSEVDIEDGLDFGPLLLALVALLVLGVHALLASVGLVPSPLAWLNQILPIAGGHETVPLGLREGFREQVGEHVGVARPWVAGAAACVAIVTGYAWTWTRLRFRRGFGEELVGLSRNLELALVWPRRLLRWIGLGLAGLTELAARGVARGLFEDGPGLVRRLGSDIGAGLGPSIRARGLGLGGAHRAVLGILLGAGLLLGWLYARPDIASFLPSDGYGFGGLQPRLIRAGGKDSEKDERPPAGEAPPRELFEPKKDEPPPLRLDPREQAELEAKGQAGGEGSP